MSLFRKFVHKSRNIHGDTYNYTKTAYTNSHTKVIIGCGKHGDFLQTPTNHLSGNGCPKCGRERTNKALRHTQEIFINKASNIHNNYYDYTKVIYKDSITKIIIGCLKHGWFTQRPSDHLGGKGCIKCSGTELKTLDKFILEADILHNNKYDYTNTIYVRALDKVVIICPIHGKFLQTPAKHLMGQGCPICGNINSRKKYLNKPTYLYYIKIITEDNMILYKIGVTTQNIKGRFRSEKHLKIIPIFIHQYSTGKLAYEHEQRLHNNIEYKYKGKPIFKKGGDSELYTCDVLELDFKKEKK